MALLCPSIRRLARGVYPVREWLRSVDAHWFGRGSPTSLGVIRILIGFLAFVDLLMIAVGFSDWFGEKSYVPLSTANWYIDPMPKNFTLFGFEKLLNVHPSLPISPPRINLLTNITDVRVIAVFYGLVVIFAFLTMIGLWTKFSSIALAVGLVSIHHRDGLILNGGDTVLRVAVLYLALAPCGLACSMDRLRALKKGKVGSEAPQVSLWVQKLIQYNVALIYFTTFWLKFGQGSYWRNMTATYYTAHINEFHRFWVPEFLVQPPMIYITSLMTLVIELALGTIVFYRPARRWVLMGGLLLHGFIEYSMNIPLFGFLVCSLYVSFYSGEEIAGFFERLGQRLKRFAVTVPIPVGQRLSTAGANFVHAVDPLHLVQYKPGKNTTLEATDVRHSWTRSLGAWPFGLTGTWKKQLLSSMESAPENAATPAPARTEKKART